MLVLGGDACLLMFCWVYVLQELLPSFSFVFFFLRVSRRQMFPRVELSFLCTHTMDHSINRHFHGNLIEKKYGAAATVCCVLSVHAGAKFDNLFSRPKSFSRNFS